LLAVIKKVARETEQKMDEVVDQTREEFKQIRTGRARPSLLDGIKANYYGQPTPLNQMAQVSAPEPRQLVVKPYDSNVIEDIEKAILKSDLGLTPNTDGDLIRINIPQLTEERRKELARQADEKAEDGKIAIRNIRREANEELEELEDKGEISEDNYHRGLDNVQDITDEHIEQIEEILSNKKEAILEV
jgi:ribosome recycling factor